MKDGSLELDNNRGERSIKPFVIGRKNWLFANTPRGDKASATIYSVIESAKENGLNPFKYLMYLFEQLPQQNHLQEPVAEQGLGILIGLRHRVSRFGEAEVQHVQPLLLQKGLDFHFPYFALFQRS